MENASKFRHRRPPAPVPSGASMTLAASSSPARFASAWGMRRAPPFEIIHIAEGILLIPYNPIETFGNRVDALLSDVKETENFRGLPDEARDAIKTKLQELVDVMQTYHVRSVEKGGDE